MAAEPVASGQFKIDGVMVYEIRLVGGETVAYSITSTGVIIDGQTRWTYNGNGRFLGLSNTLSSTPANGFAVGDSGTATSWSLFTVVASNDPYLTTGFDLTSIADAIRTKTWGTSDLTFPSQYISSISNLPTGNIQSSRSVTYNTPGSATITPSSGYVGFESAYIEFSPNVWDGQYTWTPEG